MWFILPFRRKYDVFTLYFIHTIFDLTSRANVRKGRWTVILGTTNHRILPNDRASRFLHWRRKRKLKTLMLAVSLALMHSVGSFTGIYSEKKPYKSSIVFERIPPSVESAKEHKGTKEPSGCWWEMMHGARCTPVFFGAKHWMMWSSQENLYHSDVCGPFMDSEKDCFSVQEGSRSFETRQHANGDIPWCRLLWFLKKSLLSTRISWYLSSIFFKKIMASSTEQITTTVETTGWTERLSSAPQGQRASSLDDLSRTTCRFLDSWEMLNTKQVTSPIGC